MFTESQLIFVASLMFLCGVVLVTLSAIPALANKKSPLLTWGFLLALLSFVVVFVVGI